MGVVPFHFHSLRLFELLVSIKPMSFSKKWRSLGSIHFGFHNDAGTKELREFRRSSRDSSIGK